MDTTKLPPELVAHFNAILDAKGADENARRFFFSLIVPMMESMKELVDVARLHEREACAKVAEACAEAYDAPHCKDCDTPGRTRRHAPYVCPVLGLPTDPRHALRALATAILART